MKSKQLKIEKPCSENWGNMTPTERGRFCDKCSKNVVDFTQKTPTEIFRIYQETKGTICGRIRPSQLEHPMPNPVVQHSLSLPYGKAAAGLMIAASVLGTDEIHAQVNKTQLEQIIDSGETGKLQSDESVKISEGHEELPICPVKQFCGRVTSMESGKPLVNARVSLVTAERVYSTFTDKYGMYKLNVPEEAMGDQNLISFSFEDIVREKQIDEFGFGDFYESDLIMVDAKDASTPLNHQAEPEVLVLGGMIAYSPGKEPGIYHNGQEIKRKELYDLNFNYETGFYVFLNSEMAKVVLGDKKGKYGASLYFDEVEVIE